MIFEIALWISGSLLLIALVLIVLIYAQKIYHDRLQRRIRDARQYVFDHYLDEKPTVHRFKTKFLFDVLIDIDEQVHLDPEMRARIVFDIAHTPFIRKMRKHLHALSLFKRRMAVFYLARLRTEEAYQHLMERFLIEKNESVRLRIVSNMRYGMKDIYLHHIMVSFVGASPIYQERLAVLLSSNYKRIFDLLKFYEKDSRKEIRRALVSMGSFHVDGFLTAYMKQTLLNLLNKEVLSEEDQRLKHMILDNLVQFVPDDVIKELDAYKADLDVLTAIIKAYRFFPSINTLNEILAMSTGTSLDQSITESIEAITFMDQGLLDHLLRLYSNLSMSQKEVLFPIYHVHLDYVILRLIETNQPILRAILDQLIKRKMSVSLIDFLNKNKESVYEKMLISVLRSHTEKDPTVKDECELYLNERLLKQMGLHQKKPPMTQRDKAPIETSKVRWMLRWIILSFLLYPAIYLITQGQSLIGMRLTDIMTGFVVSVNLYTIAYFGSLNMIYLLLLILAAIGSKHQVALSRSRKSSLLFLNHLLPGISILAPAYNEALSIIESVTSLLNLKYPNYEVIVINDGSKDQTLQVLLAHFDMKRMHDAGHYALDTKRIRGIYRSKNIPNLIVIDKENGGKADALNVGINFSNMPYVCGIDADSILEGDALLKLASAMLDDTKPYIALGGNIYPANGFDFDKGKAENRHIPKEAICRFQSMEYLRAFTSGRMGWSMMKSLMIISGAFGLFKKDLLIETGGYLTSSSKYKKDTVGEDMELVVRLTREALERKEAYRVQYVYNAFCYTELPSDAKTLLKQRNRWQRGLIDILSYHRKIGFNVKYKQLGMIGYPYFFLFEFLGPFFEFQGYVMLAIGLFFGMLTPSIIVMIFALSILFGMVISLMSILITEKEWNMMSKRDTIILMFYAIIENFFYRQLIGLHRVWSSIKAIRETGSWGAQKRKGFKQKAA